MALFAKDPDARLDYSIDWSVYLQNSETITASTWSVEPAETGGLVVVSESVSGATSRASVDGGRIDNVYRLINQITTDQGRTDERGISIRVVQR